MIKLTDLMDYDMVFGSGRAAFGIILENVGGSYGNRDPSFFYLINSATEIPYRQSRH